MSAPNDLAVQAEPAADGLPYDPKQYWTERFRRYGHTGDYDPEIYAYDQPQRLRAIGRALSGAGVQLGTDTRALDIGCGTGDLIDLLLRQGVGHVTGIDVSDDVVEWTRRRFGDRAASVAVHALPVERLPELRGAWDLVASVNVLQHVTAPGAFEIAVANIASVMRRGGHLVLLEFSPVRSRAAGTSGPSLVVRVRAEYVRAFERTGCRLRAEVGLPRLGVRTVRALGRLAGRLARGGARGDGGTGARPAMPGAGRYQSIRRAILAAARPVDARWVPFPAAWTDMRILIFQKPEVGG